MQGSNDVAYAARGCNTPTPFAVVYGCLEDGRCLLRPPDIGKQGYVRYEERKSFSV
jgi:hypothetical protein